MSLMAQVCCHRWEGSDRIPADGSVNTYNGYIQFYVSAAAFSVDKPSTPVTFHPISPGFPFPGHHEHSSVSFLPSWILFCRIRGFSRGSGVFLPLIPSASFPDSTEIFVTSLYSFSMGQNENSPHLWRPRDSFSKLMNFFGCFLQNNLEMLFLTFDQFYLFPLNIWITVYTILLILGVSN